MQRSTAMYTFTTSAESIKRIKSEKLNKTGFNSFLVSNRFLFVNGDNDNMVVLCSVGL